jgi:hypothetical protein
MMEHARIQEYPKRTACHLCALIIDSLPFYISGDFVVQLELEEYPSANDGLVIFLGAANPQGLYIAYASRQYLCTFNRIYLKTFEHLT